MPGTDTINDNRLRDILQAPWNKAIQSLNKILLGAFQLKYQGGIMSAFKLHSTILSYYIVVATIYALACICCGGQILPSSTADLYLPVLRATVFLAGALATALLLMAVVPVFGWIVFVIWAMMCVEMTWRVRAEIYALIRLVTANVVSLLSSFLPADYLLPI